MKVRSVIKLAKISNDLKANGYDEESKSLDELILRSIASTKPTTKQAMKKEAMWSIQQVINWIKGLFSPQQRTQISQGIMDNSQQFGQEPQVQPQTTMQTLNNPNAPTAKNLMSDLMAE